MLLFSLNEAKGLTKNIIFYVLLSWHSDKPFESNAYDTIPK